MKMRFTDTHKWNKLWFRGLSPDAKLLFLYLCDSCGDAGIIEIDPVKYSFEIGLPVEKINPALEELKNLKKLVQHDERFYHLPSFIKFQYPKGLKTNYNPHKSVWREIQKHNLNLEEIGMIQSLDQGLGKPSKVKDKIRIWDKIRIRDKNRLNERFAKLWLKATRGRLSPKIKFTDEKLEIIANYLNDYTLLEIVRVWQQASESDFLTCRNGTGFKASFDWIHKPANWQKVIDGNYDNPEYLGKEAGHGF